MLYVELTTQEILSLIQAVRDDAIHVENHPSYYSAYVKLTETLRKELQSYENLWQRQDEVYNDILSGILGEDND